MRASALACLTLIWVATPAHSTSLVEELEKGEQAVEGIQGVFADMRANPEYHKLDLRRRTEMQDVERWAFPLSRVSRIEELVKEARRAQPGRAELALKEANGLVLRGLDVMDQITGYWEYAVRIPLREHWKALNSANGHSSVLDAQILAHEKQLLDALGVGDFPHAAELGRTIENELRSATDKVTTEIMARKKGTPLNFVQRATPCPKDDFRGDSKPEPRMRIAANPDAYFPPSSVRHGEMGKIVVRARIAPSNCATAFALVVRSGYPALDAAAIKVAENSRFVAGARNGKPQSGEMNFAVRFVYNRRSPDRAPR